MWRKIGISVLVGIGSLLVISLIVQGNFSVLSRKIRAMIAPLTDRRVQLMSELVAGIQVLPEYLISYFKNSQTNGDERTCWIVILVSGGEDVRLGETVQQDRVGDQEAGDQEDQILVVRARRVFGHHSLHRTTDPLLHPDNVRSNGARPDCRRDLRNGDVLQFASAHRRVVLPARTDTTGRIYGVYEPIGGACCYVYFQIRDEFKSIAPQSFRQFNCHMSNDKVRLICTGLSADGRGEHGTLGEQTAVAG